MTQKEKGKKSYPERMKEFLASGKKVKLILAIGLAGIALILLSELLPEKKTAAQPQQSVSTLGDEAAELEERLERIISRIEGVGRSSVMVTLESGAKYIYAQESKTSSDASTDVGAGQETRTERRGSTEEKYIFIEDENGRKRALLLTTAEPVVKGVVIVCEGAEDARVKLRVLNAVTVALGITSARVSIEKMA